MKHYQNNGINILLEKTPKTPRMSVSFFFKTDKIPQDIQLRMIKYGELAKAYEQSIVLLANIRELQSRYNSANGKTPDGNENSF